MVKDARYQDEWIGTEIGLSWHALKFRDPNVELGYVKYCAPRLRRNLLIAMCLQILVLTWWCLRLAKRAFPDLCCTPPSRTMDAPRWLVQIKFAWMALCIIVAFCYIVVHSVPRFNHCMGSFARELYCVIQGIAAIASSVCLGNFYVSQLSQTTLDDAALARVGSNQIQMVTTILMLTATHLMVPVRWHMLIPLEIFSAVWFPFWVVFTSSWNDGFFAIGSHSTWYDHATQCIIVIFFAMGKRHTECTERYLFKKYLLEKSLRVSTEFKLSSRLANERKVPSEISSQVAFANLGLSGELKGHVDGIVALGRKERWVLDAGVTINHDEVLGQGGFGKVCRANLHGTPTVVKMPLAPMHEWIGVGASHLQALGNEIRLLRRLRHPNIVVFHGAVFFDHNTCFGLVLEYVDGLELNSCMTRLSNMCCVGVCLDLSRALQYLHAQDPPIVHGDLKPSNLMIIQVFWKPRAKLIDFGLARLITPNALSEGGGGGTKEWIPPEQMLDPVMQPTHHLDIFAFGSIAYFMEHGASPMQGISSGSEVLLNSRGMLTWPNSQRAFLADRARDVVHSCLAISPGMRPESMDDVRRSLQEAVDCPGPGFDIEQPSTCFLSEAPPSHRSGVRSQQAL